MARVDNFACFVDAYAQRTLRIKHDSGTNEAMLYCPPDRCMTASALLYRCVSNHNMDLYERLIACQIVPLLGPGRTLLHIAALCNDVVRIRTLVQTTVHAYTPDLHGVTPMHMAAHASSTAAIDTLLRTSNIHPTQLMNLRDNKGRTPLHYVAQYTRDVGMLAYLLKHHANPLIRDMRGQYPMDTVLALPESDPFRETARVLIDRGVWLFLQSTDPMVVSETDSEDYSGDDLPPISLFPRKR